MSSTAATGSGAGSSSSTSSADPTASARLPGLFRPELPTGIPPGPRAPLKPLQSKKISLLEESSKLKADIVQLSETVKRQTRSIEELREQIVKKEAIIMNLQRELTKETELRIRTQVENEKMQEDVSTAQQTVISFMTRGTTEAIDRELRRVHAEYEAKLKEKDNVYGEQLDRMLHDAKASADMHAEEMSAKKLVIESLLRTNRSLEERNKELEGLLTEQRVQQGRELGLATIRVRTTRTNREAIPLRRRPGTPAISPTAARLERLDGLGGLFGPRSSPPPSSPPEPLLSSSSASSSFSSVSALPSPSVSPPSSSALPPPSALALPLPPVGPLPDIIENAMRGPLFSPAPTPRTPPQEPSVPRSDQI